MREFSIRNLVQMVKGEELVLPAMQRPFVWDEERMVRLMDSLMRQFPLGSVLIWSTDKAQRYRAFKPDAQTSERPLDTFPSSQGQRRLLYVLDGQQRLTTLAVATAGSLDGRPLYLDVFSGSPDGKDPGDTYWDFRFLDGMEIARLNEAGTESEPPQHFVPFKRFMDIEPLQAGSAALALARKLDVDDSRVDLIGRAFSQAAGALAGTKSLRPHVIDDHGVTETPVAEILEIFVRVNSGGLRLHKSDLLMSLLDLQWENVQPRLVKMANQLTQQAVEVTRDMLLKTALLVIGEDSRFGKLVQNRDKVEKLAPRLETCIDRVETAWRQLVVFLQQDARILSRRFYRGSTRALLPFAVYLANNPQPSEGEKRRMVTGLYLALMSGVFGSAEARMGRFARDACRSEGAFPLEALAGQVAYHRHVGSLDDLLRRHVDLALNIAHDGNVILDGNPEQLERDHVFPQGKLRKKGVPEHEINHYANLHFLRGSDNRNKTDKPPHKWFRKPGKDGAPYSEADMRARLLTFELLEPGSFQQMLEIRGKAIRERALALFGMNEFEFDALFDEEAAAEAWTRAVHRALPSSVAAELETEESGSLTIDIGPEAEIWVGKNSAWHDEEGEWLWLVADDSLAGDGAPARELWNAIAAEFGRASGTEESEDGMVEYIQLGWVEPTRILPKLVDLASKV